MAAYNLFKKLLTVAGLYPRLYAMHSPRVGATTDAFAAGIADHVIDIRGRWKLAVTKYRYCRPKTVSWIQEVRHKTSKFN
jgi:hypothetical protein